MPSTFTHADARLQTGSFVGLPTARQCRNVWKCSLFDPHHTLFQTMPRSSHEISKRHFSTCVSKTKLLAPPYLCWTHLVVPGSSTECVCVCSHRRVRWWHALCHGVCFLALTLQTVADRHHPAAGQNGSPWIDIRRSEGVKQTLVDTVCDAFRDASTLRSELAWHACPRHACTRPDTLRFVCRHTRWWQQGTVSAPAEPGTRPTCCDRQRTQISHMNMSCSVFYSTVERIRKHTWHMHNI